MELINLLQENWLTLLIMVTVYGFGFLTAYLKERVKNKAQIADIKRLEQEKQLVIKEHQLDLEKRKYKYESKREQFVKYFNLIDDMTTKSHAEVQAKFLPMISSYNEEYLGANGDTDKETYWLTLMGTRESVGDVFVMRKKIK